jgi:urea transporter
MLSGALGVASFPSNSELEADMYRLIAVLYVLLGTTLAGIGVIIVLALNMVDAAHISLAALAGAVVAIPVSWVIGKRIFAAVRNA